MLPMASCRPSGMQGDADIIADSAHCQVLIHSSPQGDYGGLENIDMPPDERAQLAPSECNKLTVSPEYPTIVYFTAAAGIVRPRSGPDVAKNRGNMNRVATETPEVQSHAGCHVFTTR